MSDTAQREETCMIKRRTLIAGGGAFALAGPAALAALADGLAAAIAPDGQSIRVVRVFAENGATRMEDATLPADPSPYPLFKQFLTHKASSVAVYRAPSGLTIAAKAAPAREIVFIAEGDTLLAAGGLSRRCAAGTFILADGAACDERAGAAGYTAIKIHLAD
jgi:hypothetical protein